MIAVRAAIVHEFLFNVSGTQRFGGETEVGRERERLTNAVKLDKRADHAGAEGTLLSWRDIEGHLLFFFS